MNNTKALVLAGGGAKGSYQIGVFRGLREMSWQPGIVTGTSVGSLNGAFLVMDYLDQAEQLWRTLDIHGVLEVPKSGRPEELSNFVLGVLRGGGLNIDPLEDTIGMYLDEDGQWQESPEDDGQVTILTMEELVDVNPWDDAKVFHYTVEDGHVTAVTLTGTFQNATTTWVDTPDSYVPQVVMALAWGRAKVSFWSLSRQAQLRELEEADWERGVTLHQPGVVITAEVEQTGFYYHKGMGWQPEQPENHLSFTYTVALDNG